MPHNEQPAPPTLTIRDTATDTVTEHETYALGRDPIGHVWIQTGSGQTLGPFQCVDDALGYLLTMRRSI